MSDALENFDLATDPLHVRDCFNTTLLHHLLPDTTECDETLFEGGGDIAYSFIVSQQCFGLCMA